jgi:hypothetical protein
MTTLFSGTDISGRDDLLSRYATVLAAESVESTPGRVVGRVVTVLTVAFVAFTTTLGWRLTQAGDVHDVTIPFGESILDRVRVASSDGTQPNETARANATAVIESLLDANVEPHRVVGDPDGGLAVYVFARKQLEDGTRHKYARVLSTNEGGIIAMCVDETGSRGAWEADAPDLANSVQRIQSFISG